MLQIQTVKISPLPYNRLQSTEARNDCKQPQEAAMLIVTPSCNKTTVSALKVTLHGVYLIIKV